MDRFWLDGHKITIGQESPEVKTVHEIDNFRNRPYSPIAETKKTANAGSHNRLEDSGSTDFAAVEPQTVFWAQTYEQERGDIM